MQIRKFIAALAMVAFAAIAFLAPTTATFAAEVAAGPPEASTIFVGEFIGAMLPLAVEVGGLVIAALLGWVLMVVKTKFNIDIEARHREALHSALMTGLNMAVAKAGPIVNGTTFDVGSPLVGQAVNYALQSVPGAIKHFGVTPDWLRQMALAKLVDVPAHIEPGSAADVAAAKAG